MKNEIVWFEVVGQDGNALRSFYQKMFDWPLQDGPEGYGMIMDDADAKVPGGVGKAQAGDGWTTFYVNVDDINESLEQAVKLGGKVVVPATELPMTTIAVFTDPEGHPVGLAQARP